MKFATTGGIAGSMLASIALVCGTVPAAAQDLGDGPFKVGDRVECNVTQTGRNWDEGVVVPYLPSDLDTRSGRWYRVLLDKDAERGPYAAHADGVECMTGYMRPEEGGGQGGGGDAAAPQAPRAAAGRQRQQDGPFKIGDRVECSVTQSGRTWDEGVIVPYLSSDLDTRSGRWYRVLLDKDAERGPYAAHADGVECMTAFIKPAG